MREDRRITDLIRSMSTEEKAGQLNLMPYMDNTDEILELIREGKAGGILIAATALAGSEIQTAPAAEIWKLKQAALMKAGWEFLCLSERMCCMVITRFFRFR